MHLELNRDKGREFPSIANPLAVKSARVWHCNYASLSSVAVCANLETLVIATYPDASLEAVGELRRLRYLRIVHFPKVSDLAPLRNLWALETLSLASLPSWDASGKVISIASLEPIARLSGLRHLELFGVRPQDKRLRPLVGLSSLRSARFSKYPAAETRAFYEQTGVSDAFAPEPRFNGASVLPVMRVRE